MPARRGRARGAHPPGPIEPLAPQAKWRSITFATLLLVPAYWMLLAGLVASEREVEQGAPDPQLSFALGLAVVPFVFMVLAFLSKHPRAPSAVTKAMGLSLLVGIPASAVAGDAITGVVAGVGSGGACALRMDLAHSYKARALAVAGSSIFVFFLVRIAGAIALLPAPILPFTMIGVADDLSERAADRRGRDAR